MNCANECPKKIIKIKNFQIPDYSNPDLYCTTVTINGRRKMFQNVGEQES